MVANDTRGREMDSVVVLVHPLYSLFHNFDLEKKDPMYKMNDPFSRKNVQFVLGLWGRALKKAAENPKTMAIIIRPPDYSTRAYSPQRKRRVLWAAEKVDSLMRYAQKILGDRAVVVSGSKIGPAQFRKILHANHFRFGKEWSASIFGEYVTRCIEGYSTFFEWAALTPAQLRRGSRDMRFMQKLIPRLHVNKIPALSTTPLNPSKGEGHAFSMGSFHGNVRKNLRRVRAHIHKMK